MGLKAEEPDDELERPRNGCAVWASAIVIVVFVNVPLVSVGPRRLWDTAPVLVVVAVLVDLFLALFLALGIRRRTRSSVPD